MSCRSGHRCRVSSGPVRPVWFSAEHLALLESASTPESLRKVLSNLTGSDTRLVKNFAGQIIILSSHGLDDDQWSALPIGPDIASCRCPAGQMVGGRSLGEQFGTVDNVAGSFPNTAGWPLKDERLLATFDGGGSPLAQTLGTRYPIAQGPMTESTEPFAKAVSDGGAMPFSLSLMGEKRARIS